MSAEQIYLLELTGATSADTVHTTLDMAVGKIAEDLAYDADGDGRVTIRDALIYIKTPTVFRYCSGAGYTTAPTDTPANTFYEPRIADPGLFRQAMFTQGTTGGKSSPAYGTIELINLDGGLDAMVDYGFDGRDCVVKQGRRDQALADFVTVLTGSVEQAEFSFSRLILRLKDKSADLNTPVQSRKYAGTNTGGAGVEGDAALKDKLKPRLLGRAFNCSPVCVNASKLIYQINDSAISAISAVRDNGIALAVGEAGAYTDQADMEATAPNAGEYRVWYAGGCFRLGSSPAGQITVDAATGAAIADRTAGQLVKQLAGEKCGPAYVVNQSIIDLDASAPYETGIYIASDMTTAAAIDLLCNSVGAWWGFDNLGYFWAKQLTAPDSTQAITTITDAEILTIERVATGDGDRGLPTYKVNIEYAKNNLVQSGGLAGGVTGDTLTFGESSAVNVDDLTRYGTEYLRVSAIDTVVKTVHLTAPELTIQTLLTTAADALAEADRILALRSVRHDRLRVTISAGALSYPAAGYWDNESITELPVAYAYSTVIYGGYIYAVFGSNNTSLIHRLPLNNIGGPWEPIGAVTSLGIAFVGLVVNGSWLYAIAGLGTGLCYRYDLTSTTATWDATVTDLSGVQAGAGTVLSYGGYIYIFGAGATVFTTSVSAVTGRLNLSAPTGAWDYAGVTDLPAARNNSTASLYGTYAYVVGGYLSGSTRTASVIRLNLSSPAGAWDDAGVTDLPEARAGHAAQIIDNYLYIIGGTLASGSPPPVIRLNLDAPSGAWETVSGWPDPAIKWCSTVLDNGSVYFLGGKSTTDLPTTWRWRKNTVPADIAHLSSLGRTINVQLDRYGYTSGRPMRIIGCDSNYRDGLITLELWG